MLKYDYTKEENSYYGKQMILVLPETFTPHMPIIMLRKLNP